MVRLILLSHSSDNVEKQVLPLSDNEDLYISNIKFVQQTGAYA